MANPLVVVFGGFSRSGHDSLMDAISDGLQASHCPRPIKMRWREMVPGIEDHAIFSLHRLARDEPSLSSFMDRLEIPTLLATDLFEQTSFLSEVDVVISVHPWTSFILAESASRRGLDKLLIVDVAGDYCFTPVVEHERIDLYVGGVGARLGSALQNDKVVPTGVPVRATFLAENSVEPGRLYVAAGRTGYAQSAALRGLRDAVRALAPREVIVAAAGNEEHRLEFESVVGNASLTLLPDLADTSRWIQTAEWVLSKGSGPSLAEALASGATVVTYRSGVFWEDEAARYLHAAGATVSAESLLKQPSLRPWDRSNWIDSARTSTQRSVSAILRLIEHGRRAQPDTTGWSVSLSASDSSTLPSLSAWMVAALPRWVSSES